MTAPCIAIVDDEPNISTLVGMALSDAGFETRAFNTARSLLEDERHLKLDGFVCDLKMPGFDGLQLVRELARRGESKPIILMSGSCDSVRAAARRIAEEHGFQVLGALGKPIDLDELVRLMRGVFAVPGLALGGVLAALGNGELGLHYQPIFHARPNRNGRLASVEGLLRWEHPTRGTLPPGEFLHLVETGPDLMDLTVHTLDVASRQLAHWRQAGFTPRIAINVPARILHLDDDLPHVFTEVLERHGALPEEFTLELVETDDFVEGEASRAVLTRLRIHGFTLAIDDFGVGHSSMQRLSTIPFDQLKIDRSFVARAHEDAGARAIVTAGVGLARSLGISSCAEGVETLATLRTVLDCGVDELQGFGLCPPRPAPFIELQFNGANAGHRAPAAAPSSFDLRLSSDRILLCDRASGGSG